MTFSGANSDLLLGNQKVVFVWMVSVFLFGWLVGFWMAGRSLGWEIIPKMGWTFQTMFV